MSELKLERALYIAVNKDTDDIYTERVKFNKAFADEIKKKAEEVIFSPLPPGKVSASPEHGACRFCTFKNRCHLLLPAVPSLKEDILPDMNCRTCLHSSPLDDGTWKCEKHQTIRTHDEQLAGCESHLFIPALIPLELKEVQDEPSVTIKYSCTQTGKTYFNHEETAGEKFSDVPF
jgi:hypothetical protein